MGEVLQFRTAHNPDDVIEQAKGQYKDGVIIMGYDEYGNLDVRASTNLTHADVLWIVTAFTHKLMNGDYFRDS